MCGRFAKHTPNQVIAQEVFERAMGGAESAARYNVAPGTNIDVITHLDPETVYFSPMHWGFRPGWAGPDGPSPINARAESVASSRYFRGAFAHKRCLVPADGWFEWRRTGVGKLPYYITVAEGDEPGVLFFAGLWEYGEADKPVCAIITEPASAPLTHIHERQPVVLDRACLAQWLDPALEDREAVRASVRRQAPESYQVRRVSQAVNAPRNDYPELLDEVDD